MKYLIALFMFLFSATVFPDRGCAVKEPISNDSMIEIELIPDESTYVVKVRVPLEHKGEKFGMLMIHKGNDGDIFAIPLATEHKSERVEAWFYANESTLNDSKITAQFGTNCPTPIEASINITRLSN